MSTDPVEHQATVEKGLRMKIKRKTPVSSTGSASAGSTSTASPAVKLPATVSTSSSTSATSADAKSASKTEETGVSPKSRRGGSSVAEDREDRSPGSSGTTSSATTTPSLGDHATASSDSSTSSTAAANGEEKSKKKGGGSGSRGSGNTKSSAAVAGKSDKDRGDVSERKEPGRKEGSGSGVTERKSSAKDGTPSVADSRKIDSGKTASVAPSTNRKRSAGQANFSSDAPTKTSKTDRDVSSAAGGTTSSGSSSGSVSVKVEDYDTEKQSMTSSVQSSGSGVDSKPEGQGTSSSASAAETGSATAALGFDPYEFVPKLEEDDAVVSPMKKFKSEKVDPPAGTGCAPVSTTSTLCASGSNAVTTAPVLTTTVTSAVDAGLSVASATSGGTTQGTSTRTTDTSTTTCHVGVMTDPDCLGPCEPGTSIVLEGIVWSESNNGILVVNVTWRGKTYVGTLMDATKHHWASPRFQEETSLVELDWRSPKGKRSAMGSDVAEGRRLRKCRRNANGGASKVTGPSPVPTVSANGPSVSGDASSSVGRSVRKSRANAESAVGTTSAVSDITNGKLTSSGSASSSSSLGDHNGGVGSAGDVDETLLECNGPNCNKKYKHINGLRYHQSHAHKNQRLDSASCSSDELLNSAMSAPAEACANASDKGAAEAGRNADASARKTAGNSTAVRKISEFAVTADNDGRLPSGDNLSSPADKASSSSSSSAAFDGNSVKLRASSPSGASTGDVDGEKSAFNDNVGLGKAVASTTDVQKDGESSRTAVGAGPVHSMDDLSKRSSSLKQNDAVDVVRSRSADGGIHSASVVDSETGLMKGSSLPHGNDRLPVDESDVILGGDSLSRVHRQYQQQPQQPKVLPNRPDQLSVAGQSTPAGHHSSKASLSGASSKFPADEKNRVQPSPSSSSKDASKSVATSRPPPVPLGPGGSSGPISSPSANAEAAYRKHLEMMQQQGALAGLGPVAGAAHPPGMLPTPPGIGPRGPLGPLGPGGPVEEYARLAAAMYGYGLDPAAAAAYQAHLLATTNPEYRVNYERWLAEQRFHQQQMMAAVAASTPGNQPDGGGGPAAGGAVRPVDMSSKVPTPSGLHGRSSSPQVQSRGSGSHQSGGSSSGGHRHDRDRTSGSGAATPVPSRRPSPSPVRDRGLGRDMPMSIKTEKNSSEFDRKDIKRERDDSKPSIVTSSKWADAASGLVPPPLPMNVDRSKLKSGILPPGLNVDIAAAAHAGGPIYGANVATSGLLSSLSPNSAAKLVGRTQPPFDLPIGRDGGFPSSLYQLSGPGALGVSPVSSASAAVLLDPSVMPPTSGPMATNYSDMADGHHSKSFKERSAVDSVVRRSSDKQSRQPSPLSLSRSDKLSSSGSWPGGSGKDKQEDGSRFLSGGSGKPSTPQSSEKLPTPGIEGPGGPAWNEKVSAAGVGGGLLGPGLPGGVPVPPGGPPHVGSPMTLRHLHTHHHTHVVQSPAGYPLYSLIPPVPALVPPVPPPLSVPQPFIPK